MANRNRLHRRPDTRFARDGRSVFVTLNVDRRDYEYARAWAVFHAVADPDGTAECQLEGMLSAALLRAQIEDCWQPLPEIEALYEPRREYCKFKANNDDEDIPF